MAKREQAVIKAIGAAVAALCVWSGGAWGHAPDGVDPVYGGGWGPWGQCSVARVYQDVKTCAAYDARAPRYQEVTCPVPLRRFPDITKPKHFKQVRCTARLADLDARIKRCRVEHKPRGTRKARRAIAKERRGCIADVKRGW